MLSKKEANRLLDIIDVSVRCASEEDLKRLLDSLQSLVCYEFALCVLARPSYRSTDPYRIVNVSYPVSWLELYISEQFDRIDPIAAEHSLHFGLQYQPDSYQKHAGSKQFISCASAYGLKTGYSHNLKTPVGDNVSLFSFGGRSMKRRLRAYDILLRIVPHLHQALVRIAAPQENRRQVPDPGLSPREKEVLNWVKEGKTNWEISTILSISERTVKFHIQSILKKVQATTRTQAVAISLENGLIDID